MSSGRGLGPGLRHAAVVLTRPSARDFAFQLSFLMFSSDLDTNQAESQWEGRIVRTLEISEDWSNALVNRGVVGRFGLFMRRSEDVVQESGTLPTAIRI